MLEADFGGSHKTRESRQARSEIHYSPFFSGTATFTMSALSQPAELDIDQRTERARLIHRQLDARLNTDERPYRPYDKNARIDALKVNDWRRCLGGIFEGWSDICFAIDGMIVVTWPIVRDTIRHKALGGGRLEPGQLLEFAFVFLHLKSVVLQVGAHRPELPPPCTGSKTLVPAPQLLGFNITEVTVAGHVMHWLLAADDDPLGFFRCYFMHWEQMPYNLSSSVYLISAPGTGCVMMCPSCVQAHPDIGQIKDSWAELVDFRDVEGKTTPRNLAIRKRLEQMRLNGVPPLAGMVPLAQPREETMHSVVLVGLLTKFAGLYYHQATSPDDRDSLLAWDVFIAPQRGEAGRVQLGSALQPQCELVIAGLHALYIQIFFGLYPRAIVHLRPYPERALLEDSIAYSCDSLLTMKLRQRPHVSEEDRANGLGPLEFDGPSDELRCDCCDTLTSYTLLLPCAGPSPVMQMCLRCTDMRACPHCRYPSIFSQMQPPEYEDLRN